MSSLKPLHDGITFELSEVMAQLRASAELGVRSASTDEGADET